MATASAEASADGARPITVALIAGEISGDMLGAAVAEALHARLPGVRLVGVCGPRMEAAGCEALASIDALSIMGLVEVLRELPRLLRLRRDLVRQLTAMRPDLVIGIDAPDFNLGLEKRLRKRGLATAQLVCPSVWAWREGRVKTIKKAVDRVFCLLPFEPAFLKARGVEADFVGHPLADEIDETTDALATRRELRLPESGPLVAVLPGSRGGEIKYLGEPFARAAALLAERVPGVRFVTPVAKPKLRADIEAVIKAHAGDLNWTLLDGHSRQAMQAVDAVLLASGTATLECLLVGQPMVVAYRGAALTAWLMLKAGLLKVPYVSLPNLLAGRHIVPELLQDAATPANLAEELQLLLTDTERAQAQRDAFGRIRDDLRCGSARRTAEFTAEFIAARRQSSADRMPV